MRLAPARARVLARALCLFGTLAGLVPPSVWAAAQLASASAPAANARGREQQRHLLRMQQHELDQRYAVQRAQCMHRFLVFHCLDAAARNYRDAQRALRVRQQALDLLDRQERAEQERARVRANLAARVPVDPAVVRAERERRIRLQRQARSIEQQRAVSAASAPRASRAHPAGGARGALPTAPSGIGQALQGASQARAAQAERQQRQEAYQRLRQRVQEQQRRGSPPAPPLPVPPASGPLLPLR
jgi:hypothetical protein